MNTNETSHLLDVVSQFETAMLVTHDLSGMLRARPMSIAEVEKNGTLWFFTAHDSGKAPELEKDSRVAVVMQGPSRYVSITGTARLTREPERLERLWRESWRPWFPGGAQDATAVAVRVLPVAAEYWDLSGLSGVRYVADALGAMVRRQRARNTANGARPGSVL